VNVHPGNPARGLPTVMALIILSDPATGYPLAVMDGLWITKLRTAAAAAVAAHALARPESRVVGLVGCGAQADAQVLFLEHLFRLQHVKV
jgi:alanine dehydrogenase